MRALLLLLVIAGCDGDDATTAPAPPDEVYWGVPVCAVTRENAGYITQRWRDARGRVVSGDGFRRGYDRDGRLVIEESTTRTRRWTYGVDGNVATIADEYTSGSGTSNVETRVRDEAGRLVEISYSNGFRQRWRRDDEGRVVAYVAYDDVNGRVTSNAAWTLDAYGRAASGTVLGYNGDMPVYTSLAFAWDVRGRIEHTHDWVVGGTWDHDYYYVWDLDDRLVEVTQMHAGLGVVVRSEIERDRDGHIVRVKELDHDGVARWWNVYDRSKRGTIVLTQERLGGSPSIITLVDGCLAAEVKPTERIPEYDVEFEPAWPLNYLPYDPDEM